MITIVEAAWPENILQIKPHAFPNDLAHAKNDWDCNGIIQTVSTIVDDKNGMLWLIDNGSIYCSPKLIIFDLLRRNNEVKLKLNNEYNSINKYDILFTDFTSCVQRI